MVPVGHVRMGSTGVRAPVWTASGMGHWKRLTKIPGGTDCYYCINHMTCSTHVYYCPFVIVTIAAMLFAIMSPVYHVTFSDIRYIPCGTMRFMYMYTMHCIWSVSCIPCRHHDCICTTPYDGYIAYAHLHVHIAYAHLPVHIAYAHLHVHLYHVTTRQHHFINWIQL